MNRNDVLAWLKQHGTRRTLDGMARYGIIAKRAFGVPMGTLLKMKKQVGTDHDLAIALWDSGWYEARLLAALGRQRCAARADESETALAAVPPRSVSPRHRNSSLSATPGTHRPRVRAYLAPPL